MPMWREDKELSKYNKYKAKTYLAKMGRVASVLALLACLLGGLHLLVSTRVCLYWFCVHFRVARVASCHGHDKVALCAFNLWKVPKSCIGKSPVYRVKIMSKGNL